MDVPSDRVLDISSAEIRIKYIDPTNPYPKEAKDSKIEGFVTLTIIVDKDGKVSSARAISGPDLFRRAAEEYWSKTLLFPYLKNGAPRIVRFTANLSFRVKK